MPPRATAKPAGQGRVQDQSLNRRRWTRCRQYLPTVRFLDPDHGREHHQHEKADDVPILPVQDLVAEGEVLAAAEVCRHDHIPRLYHHEEVARGVDEQIAGAYRLDRTLLQDLDPHREGHASSVDAIEVLQ